MKKIESLTSAQIARFPEFVEKWKRIGLSCEPCDRAEVERAVALAYSKANLPAPRVVICDGPISGAIVHALLRKGQSAVGASVWASVGASVGASVRDSVGASVVASVNNMWYCSHDAGYLGFYDFFREALYLVEQTENLTGQIALGKSCGWISFYSGFAFPQQRHSELHLNRDGKLHHDGGMAVKYRDGWGVHALNGVRVPAWLAEESADSMDAGKFMGLENVEHRREFIRKVGLPRIVQKLSPRVVNEEKEVIGGPYRLLEFSLSGRTKARALHMINPSVGADHIEFVPREIETVEQAIHWRKPDAMRRIPVSEKGVDWQQHGDVCIWPEGATALKPYPCEIA